MRWSLLLSAVIGAVAAASAKPDVDVTVKFPPTNPFAKVYNGHSSVICLSPAAALWLTDKL